MVGAESRTDDNHIGPAVDALTASNLVRHAKSLEQGYPRPTLAADGKAAPAPACEAKTLGMDDASMAMRAAYLQFQQSRREKGAASRVDKTCFLSDVPEVDADVDYRFNFVVVGAGESARHAVESACGSRAARQVEGDRRGTPPEADPQSQHVQAQRCLCAVEGSGAGRECADVRRLARLVFHPMTFGQELPACSSRSEALSTALVFMLGVDEERAGGPSLGEQLQSLANAVERQRQRVRAGLRPVRAAVLCSHAPQTQDPAAPSEHGEGWAPALAFFEMGHGYMWKFGPIAAGDGDSLHAAFAEMAALRILQGRGAEPPGAGPGGDAAKEGPGAAGEDAEGEDAEGKDADGEERALLEQRLQQRAEACGAGASRRSVSQCRSECSEGWQQPPIFEAEREGSTCSEGVLEQHAKAFGLDPSDLLRNFEGFPAGG